MKSAVLTVGRKKFHGRGFGKAGTYKGELVFNTAMTGYVEAITDPSYIGQMLLFTYPLIGNYGVNRAWMQSSGAKVSGLIVHELCRHPYHFESECTLEEFIEKEGIGGVEGVDTRAITQLIRTHGTMSATLVVSEDL